MAASAKTLIGDSSATAGELAASARVWNAQAGNAGATSKYVTSVQIAEATGEITVTFNAANVGNIPANSTLVFTPMCRMLPVPRLNWVPVMLPV